MAAHVIDILLICYVPYAYALSRSASKDPQMEATYLKLLKESSPHEKAITRDLGRTFPQHEVFTDGHGIGQENLFNVLKAYSMCVDTLCGLFNCFT